MANPRTTPEFEGIGEKYATYIIDNSTITFDATKANGAATTMIGKAVTLSAARTVALAADGDAIEGKLVKVEADNRCTVQTGGFTTLPAGTGAALTLGKKFVGALLSAAKGYIRETNTGTAAENGKSRGRIIDAADTTAVIIDL